jgi:hypothetical protein
MMCFCIPFALAGAPFGFYSFILLLCYGKQTFRCCTLLYMVLLHSDFASSVHVLYYIPPKKMYISSFLDM